jgi:hypothetical protein
MRIAVTRSATVRYEMNCMFMQACPCIDNASSTIIAIQRTEKERREEKDEQGE